MHYEPHEYCLVFPEMAPEQFRRLSADIKANGLLHEIVLYEGKILDGRHRFRACSENGVEPRFTNYVGTDAAGFVASENIARRHLSVSQLGMVGANLAEVEGVRASERQVALAGTRCGQTLPPNGGKVEETGSAASFAAKALGISERSVERAISVKKKGIPEIALAVEKDEMKVNEAERIVRLKPDSQRRIIAISDKRERQAATVKALNISGAKKQKAAHVAAAALPGTDFVRRFMGRLELMTADLEGEFDLADSQAIFEKFVSEMEWDQPQLNAQLQRIKPVMRAIAYVYDAALKNSQEAA